MEKKYTNQVDSHTIGRYGINPKHERCNKAERRRFRREEVAGRKRDHRGNQSTGWQFTSLTQFLMLRRS
ncbi:hypothetical protein TNCV_2130931 [Trichonephila clavipes]|nr:hypothetical protein TNCV_2130931 [Trichonephila clavipes]